MTDLIQQANDRAAALRESGLPECRDIPVSLDAQGNRIDPLVFLRTLKAHQRDCPVCLARKQYADERFGSSESIVLDASLEIDRLWRMEGRGPLLLGGGASVVLALLALGSHAILPGRIGAPLAWTFGMIGALILVPCLYHATPKAIRAGFGGRFLVRILAATAGTLYFDALVRLWDNSSPLRYLISFEFPGAFLLKALVVGVAGAIAWPIFSAKFKGPP